MNTFLLITGHIDCAFLVNRVCAGFFILQRHYFSCHLSILGRYILSPCKYPIISSNFHHQFSIFMWILLNIIVIIMFQWCFAVYLFFPTVSNQDSSQGNVVSSPQLISCLIKQLINVSVNSQMPILFSSYRPLQLYLFCYSKWSNSGPLAHTYFLHASFFLFTCLLFLFVCMRTCV